MVEKVLFFYGFTVCIFIRFAVGPACGVEALNVPPPDLTIFPKNLARNHAGAEIDISGASSSSSNFLLSHGGKDENQSALAKLADDPSVSYPLASGQTSVLISLARVEPLRYISFLTAEGLSANVSIFTSSEKIDKKSDKWTLARIFDVNPSNFQYAVDLSGIEARYVKIEFNTSQNGRIAGFGIYGEESTRDFIERESDLLSKIFKGQKTPVDVDLAALYAGASVRYVSSARNIQFAARMIDDDPQSAFAFSPNDERPFLILDLGQPRLVNRAAFVMSSKSGTIEIAVHTSTGIKELEPNADTPGTLQPPQQKMPTHEGATTLDKREIVLPPQLLSKKPSLTQVANSILPESLSDRKAVYPVNIQTFSETNGYLTVAKLEDRDGSFRRSVDFEPQIARYILIRFTPDKRVALSGNPFYVGDISVFGELVAGVSEGGPDTSDPADSKQTRRSGGRGALTPSPALIIGLDDPNVASK